MTRQAGDFAYVRLVDALSGDEVICPAILLDEHAPQTWTLRAPHTGVEIHASEKYHAYYQHARSLGGFRAIDCFYLARQAAACDVVACAVTPSFVCNEGTQRLSFAIKVF